MKSTGTKPATDAENVTRKPRTVFSKEFKLSAVQRLRDGQQSVTALALELGLRRNQLYKWEAALEENGGLEAGFKQRGRKPAGQESEVVRLRRELAQAQEEIEILKKFDAYLKRMKR